jgi:hypothetical protein
MTEYSQNGYSIDPKLISSFTVPGSSVKLNLRKGATSVVLLDFAAWFNREIEPLKQAQCGGYNNRVIAGSKTKSNHASGTAEDLNWSEHPRGNRDTFTPAEQSKIRARLKYYEGVLRWGGDYVSTTDDDMHFEINKGIGEVTRIAAKINNDKKPARVPVQMSLTVVVPQLKQGDDDSKLDGYNLINRIQGLLGVKRDGVWGPQTTAAIARWMHEPEANCRVLTEHIYRNVFGAWAGPGK